MPPKELPRLSTTAMKSKPLMSQKSEPKQSSACLLSDHPVVIEQFKRAMGKLPGVKLQGLLLNWSEKAAFKLPRAAGYVIDARDQRHAKLLCGRILKTYPKARVLIVSELLAEPQAFALLRIGVKGLLSYEEVPAQLHRAVEAVIAGGYWVPRAVLSRFVESILDAKTEVKIHSLPANLSPRERVVLDSLLKNESNKEIASHLNISERTVKFHVSNLLTKYSVRRRADLIVLWMHDTDGTTALRAAVN